MFDLTIKMNSRRGTSSPQLIGKVVARAVRKRRPRTRYISGYMVHIGLISRRMIGDRIYDRGLKKGMN